MTPLRKLLLLMTLLFAAAGCRRAAAPQGSAPQTQTIAPAAAKPAPPNDNEALTQTVDIEDSRSEAEGAGTTTTPPPPAKKAAPPVKKKK